jgi:hypothetical protein
VLPRHGTLHKCQLRPLSRRRDNSGWSFAHVSPEEMRCSARNPAVFVGSQAVLYKQATCANFPLCIPSPPFLSRLTNPISRHCLEKAGSLLAVLGARNCCVQDSVTAWIMFAGGAVGRAAGLAIARGSFQSTEAGSFPSTPLTRTPSISRLLSGSGPVRAYPCPHVQLPSLAVRECMHVRSCWALIVVCMFGGSQGVWGACAEDPPGVRGGLRWPAHACAPQ